MGLRRSFKPTNLVANSNFASGYETVWSFSGATHVSLIDSVETFIATAQYGRIKQANSFTVTENHKYYYAVEVKTDSALVKIELYAKTATAATKSHSGSNSFERLSVIQTGSNGTTIQLNVIDLRTSGWTNISLKKAMVLDLTAIGVSADILALSDANLKAWCDLNIPVWFDGTLSGGRFGGIGGLR